MHCASCVNRDMQCIPLIFCLPRPQSDFLAVEMRRGKVAFLWDLGSGSTRLEFPDVSINDNRWHTIYITR